MNYRTLLQYKWSNPPPLLESALPHSHDGDDDDISIIHSTVPLSHCVVCLILIIAINVNNVCGIIDATAANQFKNL